MFLLAFTFKDETNKCTMWVVHVITQSNVWQSNKYIVSIKISKS